VTITEQRITVAKLEQRLTELPVLPMVLLELLRLDPRADDHYERVSRLIARDPALATRVLRVANSAAFSRGRSLVHLEDAIARLGSVPCANLVIAESTVRVFTPRHAWQRGLWVHAIGVAVLAHSLAASGLVEGADASLAYLAGLLHDIGRFVLYLEAPDELRAVDETAWTTPEELLASEQRVCGFNHVELGFRAASKWGLPAPLPLLIHHHHASPPYAPELGAAMVAVVQCVVIADHLSVASLQSPEWPTLSMPAVVALGARALPLPASAAKDRDHLLHAAFTEIAATVHALGLD
jgi:putative nucleotidyltransferase with HDIG domain